MNDPLWLELTDELLCGYNTSYGIYMILWFLDELINWLKFIPISELNCECIPMQYSKLAKNIKTMTHPGQKNCMNLKRDITQVLSSWHIDEKGRVSVEFIDITLRNKNKKFELTILK